MWLRRRLGPPRALCPSAPQREGQDSPGSQKVGLGSEAEKPHLQSTWEATAFPAIGLRFPMGC